MRTYVLSALVAFSVSLGFSYAQASPESPGSSRSSGCLTFAEGLGTKALAQIAKTTSRVLNDAGICNTLLPLPPKRALLMVKSGQVDGDIVRISGYGDYVGGDVVQVPTALLTFDAFLVTASPTVNDLEAFNAPLIQLGVPREGKWVEDIVKAFPHAKTVGLPSTESMVKMLEGARIDGFFATQSSIHAFDLDKKYKVLKVKTFGLHIWLHSARKADLWRIDTAVRNHLGGGGLFLDEPER